MAEAGLFNSTLSSRYEFLAAQSPGGVGQQQHQSRSPPGKPPGLETSRNAHPSNMDIHEYQLSPIRRPPVGGQLYATVRTDDAGPPTVGATLRTSPAGEQIATE